MAQECQAHASATGVVKKMKTETCRDCPWGRAWRFDEFSHSFYTLCEVTDRQVSEFTKICIARKAFEATRDKVRQLQAEVKRLREELSRCQGKAQERIQKND